MDSKTLDRIINAESGETDRITANAFWVRIPGGINCFSQTYTTEHITFVPISELIRDRENANGRS